MSSLAPREAPVVSAIKMNFTDEMFGHLTRPQDCGSTLNTNAGLLGGGLGLTGCTTPCTGNTGEACGGPAPLNVGATGLQRITIYEFIVSGFPYVCVPSSVTFMYFLLFAGVTAYRTTGGGGMAAGRGRHSEILRTDENCTTPVNAKPVCNFTLQRPNSSVTMNELQPR